MMAHQPPPCCSSAPAGSGARAAAAAVPWLLRRWRRPEAGLAGVAAAAGFLALLPLPRRLATPPVEPGVFLLTLNRAGVFLAAGVLAAGALAGVRPGVPVRPVFTTCRRAGGREARMWWGQRPCGAQAAGQMGAEG